MGVGFGASFVDMSDFAGGACGLRPTTKLIWMETPSNPGCFSTDIQVPVAKSPVKAVILGLR